MVGGDPLDHGPPTLAVSAWSGASLLSPKAPPCSRSPCSPASCSWERPFPGSESCTSSARREPGRARIAVTQPPNPATGGPGSLRRPVGRRRTGRLRIGHEIAVRRGEGSGDAVHDPVAALRRPRAPRGREPGPVDGRASPPRRASRRPFAIRGRGGQITRRCGAPRHTAGRQNQVLNRHGESFGEREINGRTSERLMLQRDRLERAAGIEPAYSAWEADTYLSDPLP